MIKNRKERKEKAKYSNGNSSYSYNCIVSKNLCALYGMNIFGKQGLLISDKEKKMVRLFFFPLIMKSRKSSKEKLIIRLDNMLQQRICVKSHF